MSDRDRLLQQIEKVTESSVLHGSESLCKLLRYLAQQAIEHPGVPVKEYQIATEVFGRPTDFDPQSDSAIRVQAGRLRSKLSEYYASEGVQDSIHIELPKGSYALNFHKHVEEDRPSNGHRHSEHTGVVPAPASFPKTGAVAIAVLAVLLLVSVLVIAQLWAGRNSVVREAEPASPDVQAFWKPFVVGPQDPWVVFSNAAFVGRPETGIRYFDPAKDAGARVWDHYTGVGEVLAVHSLDQVFETMNRRLRVKRGSLLSLDDVSNNNLIFLGSPSENLTLKDIPNTREFVFQRLTAGSRKGDLAIANVHPEADEQSVYLATPSDQQLSDDYAVISYMPGLNPEHFVLIMAGITTFGTQSAAEYLSRPESIKALMGRLGTAQNDKFQPFEALLHVRVTRGVPLEAELVALRKR
jgi:hypothetical protein